MDLSTFQLVDAINDMDMLRNLSDQQQQQPQQYAQQQQQQQHNNSNSSSSNAYNQLHGDIDMLFQSDHTNASPHMNSYIPAYKNHNATPIMSSPHYRTSLQNEVFDQEDILTPLISPAMTPSFEYQMHQQQKHHSSINFPSNGNNEMDFSPLSSPAILPQLDRQQSKSNTIHARPSYQTQLSNSAAVEGSDKDNYENMSANQICEQYEQLEHAKLLITQKLSELQKSQRHHNHYEDQGYQKSLLSSDSNSSKGSSSPLSKNNGTSMHHGDLSIHRQLSKPNSPNQSPHMEPATPASLMNMKVSSSGSSKLQFSSSGRGQQQYFNNKPSFQNNNHLFQSPVMNASSSDTMMLSPMMTPTTSMTQHTVPLSPLALHPRTSGKARSSLSKEKSSRYSKKQRRESTEAKSSTSIHASPRALKPLLISPTLNPGLKPLPSSIVPASRNAVHSVEDAERILATRSNYQNLMEGKGAALGIAFSTQIKSGLEVRRTAHKAAEQKRRDSLKEWFDRLRREVEDGYVKRQKTLMSQVIKAQELEKNNNSKQKSTDEEEPEDASAAVDTSAMKPLSKVLLLQYAYEYIASLKDTLQEKDETIEKLLAGEITGNETNRKRKQDDVEEHYADSDKEMLEESDAEENNHGEL